jgi:hypothetical protein
MADPNYHEMELSQQQIPESNPHCIRFWNGKHAWPPADCMRFAFDWVKAGEMPVKEARARMNKYYLKCSAKMNLSEKEQLLHSLYFISSSLRISGRKDSSSLAVLRSSPDYLKFRQSREKDRLQEIQQKAIYQDALFRKNSDWWKQETAKLRQAKAGSWKEQRMLGFLSLLGWSVSTRALQQGSQEEAARFAELYGIIDPGNFEPWYQKAVIFSRAQDGGRSESCLRKAISLGFKDKNRMLQQPEFRGKGFESLFPE